MLQFEENLYNFVFLNLIFSAKEDNFLYITIEIVPVRCFLRWTLK